MSRQIFVVLLCSTWSCNPRSSTGAEPSSSALVNASAADSGAVAPAGEADAEASAAAASETVEGAGYVDDLTDAQTPALVRAPRVSAPDGISGTPLFGCYVANFAWSPVFRGFVIDDTGRIWSYDRVKNLRGRRATWTPKQAGRGDAGMGERAWFDGAQLRAMFWQAESTFRVPRVELEEHAKLIADARLGKITRTQTAVDAGGRGCDAFFWNATRDAYERVELGTHGDWWLANSAPAARELTRWLRAIEREILEKEKPR